MKTKMKLKSIRLTVIAVALALVCSFTAIAADVNRAVTIFGEDYSLSSFSQLFGSNSKSDGDLNNSIRTENIANNAMLTPPTNDKIAFHSWRDGNAEIYAMNTDGTNQTNLTNAATLEGMPSYSFDGRKILFVSTRDGNQEIYKMNTDGTNQIRLTNNSTEDYQPSFSPDGSKIVFVSIRDSYVSIFVMNADGTNEIRLTNFWDDFNPSFSPDGNKIAFTRNDSNGMDIFMMGADGGQQTRLTTDSTLDDKEPSFSPDGSKIVFTRGSFFEDNEIYLMNPDGTNQTPLTNNTANDYEPAFSPDGGKIAFTSNRDNNEEIYAMNLNGTNQTNLTNNFNLDGNAQWQPVVLPPSLRINDVSIGEPDSGTATATFTITLSDTTENAVVVHYSTADNSAAAPGDYTGISNIPLIFNPNETSKIVSVTINSDVAAETTETFFVNLSNAGNALIADAQGIGAIQSQYDNNGRIAFQSLNSNREINTADANGGNRANLTNASYAPSFSPDGSKIVFQSSLDNNSEIYIANPDGSNLINLTNTEQPINNGHPAFSPDGSRIVFVSYNNTGGSGICIMNSDGTNLSCLPNTSQSIHPSFSPDGSKIVFVSGRNYTSEIFVMNADGTNQTRLSYNSFGSKSDFRPSFSPDGSKIVFASVENGVAQIYIMNTDGSNKTNLSNDPAKYDYDPAFAPDGRIIYSSSRNISAEIYVMNADGSNQTRLFAGLDSADDFPSWQPLAPLTACTFSINPNSASLPSNTSVGAIAVTANDSSCVWTATGNDTWISITSGGNGTGNGSVAYTIAANNGAARTGTLNVGGETFTINQAATDTPCSFELDPTFAPAFAIGGNGVIAVTASDSSCAWTATSNDAWISITSGASGTGNGSVAYTVEANDGAARTGTLTVGGEIFSVYQEPETVSVSMRSHTTMPSETVFVPIDVSDTFGRGIISFDFEVTFNPEVLTLNDVTDTAMTSGMTITFNSPSSGRVRVSGFGTTPLGVPGNMVLMTFTAIGAPASCSNLHFAQFQFNDGIPPSTTTDGQVCINTSVSGTVNYFNSPETRAVPNVTLRAVGSTLVHQETTTAADGSYILTNFDSGAYTVTPSKTGALNNAVSALDAAQVARYAVELETFTANQLIVADVSNNGTVNSYDAALIAQFASNIANPGSAGIWKFLPASRAYNNLTANQTGQDYAAILMGDVTGNWTPPTPLAERNAEKSQSDANAVPVGLPMLNAPRNQIVTVPISVGDVTGRGFLAYDLEVSFDPAVLQLDAAAPVNTTGTISSGVSVAANPNLPGRLLVTAYGVNYLQGAGTLLNLRFRVIGQGGQVSPLNFERLVFNENPANSVTQNGQITVQSPTAATVPVGGRVTAADGNGIRNVIVTMTDAQGNRRIARSSSFGYFQFTDVPVGDNYIFTVSSKRFIFSSPSQVRNINQATEDINFVADN